MSKLFPTPQKYPIQRGFTKRELQIISNHVVKKLLDDPETEQKIVDIKHVKKTKTELDRVFTYEKVESVVSEHYNISIDAIMSKCRKRELVICRQLCMSIMKQYSKKTFKAIGWHYDRDHSTVIYSSEMIRNLIETDRDFKKDYENILQKIDPKGIRNK